MAKPVIIDVSPNPESLWSDSESDAIAALEVPFGRVISKGDLAFNDHVADQNALYASPHMRHTHRFEVDQHCLGVELQFVVNGAHVASAVLAGGSKFIRRGKVRDDEDKAGIEVRWQPATLKKVLPA